MSYNQDQPTVDHPLEGVSTLEDTIRSYIEKVESNGIRQHSRKWLHAKKMTIGGSSLGTLQGKNALSSATSIISEKIGLTHFRTSTAPQWGNLFEDVIKQYVEKVKNCVVYGEDAYIEGAPGSYTAYSPDGLAVVDGAITLLEFKCPYSRIPTGIPPPSYVSQVKMGLDMIPIATTGLLIEGVFRRCRWDQLDTTPNCDTTLVNRSVAARPLAVGVVGLYFDEASYQKYLSRREGADRDAMENMATRLWDAFNDEYGDVGDASNDYMSADLTTAPPALFALIMNAYDQKIIRPWYTTSIYVDPDTTDSAITDGAVARMELFRQHCESGKYTNVGLLPWKLLSAWFTTIDKEPNYLQPWIPMIQDIMGVVERCNADPDNSYRIYMDHLRETGGDGFSDGQW
jgi:hypothetical protein